MAFSTHPNLAISLVATAPSPATSGTSLVVTAGEGVRFSGASVGNPIPATIWPVGVMPTPANAEIVGVTARATDTLTIVRTPEGGVARTVLVGDQIAATITAKSLTDIESVIGSGDVVGPSSSVDNTLVRFDSTTGKLIQGYASNGPTVSDTGAMVISETAGESGLTITGATQTTNFPALNISQTWNASGTAFTGVKLNVTATAAASTSSLFDFQLAGNSLLRQLTTNGRLQLNAPGGATSTLVDFLPGAFNVQISVNNGTDIAVFNTGPSLTFTRNASYILWNEGTRIYSDAANVFAQRNGSSAQKTRIYNTFTTVETAGEWFAVDWATTANVCNLQCVKGSSSGTARVLTISYGGTQASPVAAITVPITSGNVVFGGGVQLSNAAVTGLVAGVLAASTNASIVLYDSGGQAYRVPCII